jgi:hypothetical protein
VALAVMAALGGVPEAPPPLRRARALRLILAGFLVVVVVLAAVVALRPPAGIAASVTEGDQPIGVLPAGPVDVVGRNLQALPRLRRPRLAWTGALRAPESGTFTLWAEGRGRLEVRLDGWPVLAGEGDPLHARSQLPIGGGEHRLEVRLEREAPGARLRLGWATPSEGALLVVPPRALGPEIGRAWWFLTDLLALGAALLLAALVQLVPWTARRALPAPSTLTRFEVAASAFAYAVLLAVMSWPLVTDPAHFGMTDRPDGRLNAWILAWDAHALTTAPSRLFDAPAFHPLPDALAFSENLLVPAVLSLPFQGGGPVLAYNAALLLSLLVSGLGAAALVRRVTGDRLAAFVAGALFAAGAHRWIRLAHLHAQVTLFLPFAFLALDHFWEDRRWRTALLTGLLLALQGWSSVYLGAITALGLGAAVLVMVARGLPARDLAKLAAGGVLAAALLWPAVRPYLRMRAFQGVEFTIGEVSTYATTLESYAASGTRLYGAWTQRHLEPERVQDTLFPGLAPLVLGLAGLAAAPRRYRAVFVFASGLAILFSLGPATAFYRFLHDNVVLVRGVRALSRFSLLPVLFLCVLTGLALAGRRRLFVLLALVLGLLESSQVPLGYARWEGLSASARWLRGRPGAVAVLPLGEDDTAAMLDGAAHFRPMVNGDSGFVPRPYARMLELLGGPLGEEGLRLLRAVSVAHVVSRRDEPLPEAARFDGERVYLVPPGPKAEAVEPGRPAATVWTERALIDLGEVRPVGRVVFTVTDAPWIAEPHVAASLDGVAWEQLDARASLADATMSLLRDPRGGRGAIVFPRTKARYLRLGPRVPARPGLLEVGE